MLPTYIINSLLNLKEAVRVGAMQHNVQKRENLIPQNLKFASDPGTQHVINIPKTAHRVIIIRIS